MAGRLLKLETRKAMWTEQRTVAGKLVGYALGFGVREIQGKRVIQHSGAQSRVSTMLCMLPEEQIAVVIMCNLEGARLGGLAQQIAFSVSREASRRDVGGKE
jgi:CubicO group peptidase (beta-lactamase class C family)